MKDTQQETVLNLCSVFFCKNEQPGFAFCAPQLTDIA